MAEKGTVSPVKRKVTAMSCFVLINHSGFDRNLKTNMKKAPQLPTKKIIGNKNQLKT